MCFSGAEGKTTTSNQSKLLSRARRLFLTGERKVFMRVCDSLTHELRGGSNGIQDGLQGKSRSLMGTEVSAKF